MLLKWETEAEIFSSAHSVSFSMNINGATGDGQRGCFVSPPSSSSALPLSHSPAQKGWMCFCPNSQLFQMSHHITDVRELYR